jgi:hypothetical protein
MLDAGCWMLDTGFPRPPEAGPQITQIDADSRFTQLNRKEREEREAIAKEMSEFGFLFASSLRA